MAIVVQVPEVPIARTDLAQDADMLHPIPLKDIYIFDSATAADLTTGGTDDLGIYPGTHGTSFPYIGTGDVKAAGCTRKCRFTFVLPPEFVAAGAVFIRARAGMVTTVADTSATIDFAAYKAAALTGATKTGSDLVLTSATTINSLDWADVDFEIDGTGLVAGDEIDVLCIITIVDAATATAVIGGFRPLIGCTKRG